MTPVNHSDTRTRFAPSPTGHLHLGHLYAAQVAHDLARKTNGKYLLRFEDIDTTRTKKKYYESILDDLHFFNLHHDETPILQTQLDRSDAYSQAITTLNKLGVTYPCFCSRKDILRETSNITNAPHHPITSSQLYPGTCQNLNHSQQLAHIKQGKIPSIRINTKKAATLTGELTFTDSIHGNIKVNPHILGDTILARKDIGTSYHIASVIDDAHQHITHVTRGDDLIESTHLHRVIQALLNLPEPTYHHHPLILDDQYNRLAKRSNSISINELRKNGVTLDTMNQMIQAQLTQYR